MPLTHSWFADSGWYSPLSWRTTASPSKTSVVKSGRADLGDRDDYNVRIMELEPGPS